MNDHQAVWITAVLFLSAIGLGGRAFAQSPLERSLQIRQAQMPSDGEIHREARMRRPRPCLPSEGRS